MRYSTEIAKKKFGNTPIVACEIGTFKGDNALDILKNLNISKIYLIDAYTKYDGYEVHSDCDEVESAKSIAHKKLEKYSDKIVWIEDYSANAVEHIKEQLDFVYIDGNHTHPYIDDDIKNYYPLVKDGGVFSGHDFSEYWKDVIFAVCNAFRYKEIKTMNRDWVIIK